MIVAACAPTKPQNDREEKLGSSEISISPDEANAQENEVSKQIFASIDYYKTSKMCRKQSDASACVQRMLFAVQSTSGVLVSQGVYELDYSILCTEDAFFHNIGVKDLDVAKYAKQSIDEMFSNIPDEGYQKILKNTQEDIVKLLDNYKKYYDIAYFAYGRDGTEDRKKEYPIDPKNIEKCVTQHAPLDAAKLKKLADTSECAKSLVDLRNRWYVWGTGDKGLTLTSTPMNMTLKNGSLTTVVKVPKGLEIPKPTNRCFNFAKSTVTLWCDAAQKLEQCPPSKIPRPTPGQCVPVVCPATVPPCPPEERYTPPCGCTTCAPME